MSYCTAINCIDGRVQLPVIRYLKERFKIDYVDTITEPGPNLILAEQTDQHTVQSILKRLDISIKRHDSIGVAIVGHHDCAGNPASKDDQVKHILASIRFLQEQHNDIEVIGLWVCDKWGVQEVG